MSTKKSQSWRELDFRYGKAPAPKGDVCAKPSRKTLKIEFSPLNAGGER